MPSIEENNDDFREVRARVDSIASAVFLISGGALSLSITVLMGNLESDLITPDVVRLSKIAWYLLLAAVILFLVLKVHLIHQAYLRLFHGEFINRHLTASNRIGWTIGLLGFVAFVTGMIFMVYAATTAIGAN